jgi:hypothetical protein
MRIDAESFTHARKRKWSATVAVGYPRLRLGEHLTLDDGAAGRAGLKALQAVQQNGQHQPLCGLKLRVVNVCALIPLNRRENAGLFQYS